MKHLGTKTIETDRLILRRFTVGDAQAMFDNWASDDAVTRYLTWPTHTNVDVSKMVVQMWVENYAHDDFYNWAIELKAIAQPVGNISVVRCSDNSRRAEMGYCMGKKWWHQGIMSEALAAVIGYLIREVGINRVEARHAVENPGSGGVMKKCGMTYEGTLRQGGWCNAGMVDLKLYSILACEYQK